MILDKNLLEQLYYEYSPRLVNYARNVLQDKDMASDLVQDSFVRLWERYKGRDSEFWPAVLYTMTKNRCLDHLKHLSVEHKVISSDITSSSLERLVGEDLSGNFPSAEDDLLADELNKELNRLIDTLPDKCREVFRMSRMDGMKNDEIASALGISVKAVEKHITKALKVLRDELDNNEGYGNPRLNSIIYLIIFQ